MTGITYSFNLDPVSSAAVRYTQPAYNMETSQAIGGQYQSLSTAGATSSSVYNASGYSACGGTGSRCFLVHSEGPGVTTLSIGEEDGSSGEYLTLPVVDGVEFLAPPADSFTRDPSYEITTLAIGEEDAGVALPSAVIGAEASVVAGKMTPSPASTGGDITNYFRNVTLSPIDVAAPVAATPVYETVNLIETEYAGYASAQPLNTQSVEIAAEDAFVTPRLKPASIASAGAPLPELKPSIIPSSIMTAQSVPQDALQNTKSVGGNFVSVGDYDAYLMSLGTVTEPVQTTNPALDSAMPAATLTSEGLEGGRAPITGTLPLSGPSLDNISAPSLKAPSQVGAPAPQPVFTAPLPSVLTAPTAGNDLMLRSTTFSDVAPMSIEKTLDAPNSDSKLSAEDYKITTLALGEEDAGGG